MGSTLAFFSACQSLAPPQVDFDLSFEDIFQEDDLESFQSFFGRQTILHLSAQGHLQTIQTLENNSQEIPSELDPSPENPELAAALEDPILESSLESENESLNQPPIAQTALGKETLLYGTFLVHSLFPDNKNFLDYALEYNSTQIASWLLEQGLPFWEEAPYSWPLIKSLVLDRHQVLQKALSLNSKPSNLRSLLHYTVLFASSLQTFDLVASVVPPRHWETASVYLHLSALNPHSSVFAHKLLQAIQKNIQALNPEKNPLETPNSQEDFFSDELLFLWAQQILKTDNHALWNFLWEFSLKTRANEPDSQGNSWLLQASQAGALEILKELQSKLSPHALNSKQDNAFLLAAQNGHIPILKYALAQQWPILEQSNLAGENALYIAVKNSQLKAAQFLLEQIEQGTISLSCSLTQKAQDQALGAQAPSALHLALEQQQLPLAVALLNLPCPINLQDPLGTLPLNRAIASGSEELLDAFLAETHELKLDALDAHGLSPKDYDSLFKTHKFYSQALPQNGSNPH